MYVDIMYNNILLTSLVTLGYAWAPLAHSPYLLDDEETNKVEGISLHLPIFV